MDNSDSRIIFLKQRLEDIEKELLNLNYKKNSLNLELKALKSSVPAHRLLPERQGLFERKKSYNKRELARKEMLFKPQYKVQKKLSTLYSKINNLIIQKNYIKKELEEISK